MSLDAISQVQSRIAEIQQGFTPATTQSQSKQSTAATAANNLQFADLLDAASSLGSDAASSGSATDASNPSSALANALGIGDGTSGSGGSSSSLADALSNLTGTSGTSGSGLGALASVLGNGGLGDLANVDPSSIASLAQALGGGTATSSGTVANSPGTQKFVQSALAMSGDTYVYGASGSPLDPHPKSFDCSGLTQWAAGRAGVTLPRTAQQQYLSLKNQGQLIPVQQAINTPGALLFSFSSEPSPTNMYPSHAHVAISLGNGKTIEARGHAYGVGIFDAKDRFNYAGVIPGLSA